MKSPLKPQLITIKVRIKLHEIPMDFSTVPSMDLPMAPVASFGAAASDHLRAATRGAVFFGRGKPMDGDRNMEDQP